VVVVGLSMMADLTFYYSAWAIYTREEPLTALGSGLNSSESVLRAGLISRAIVVADNH
jgi:hypothetical protein